MAGVKGRKQIRGQNKSEQARLHRVRATLTKRTKQLRECLALFDRCEAKLARRPHSQRRQTALEEAKDKLEEAQQKQKEALALVTKEEKKVMKAIAGRKAAAEDTSGTSSDDNDGEEEGGGGADMAEGGDGADAAESADSDNMDDSSDADDEPGARAAGAASAASDGSDDGGSAPANEDAALREVQQELAGKEAALHEVRAEKAAIQEELANKDAALRAVQQELEHTRTERRAAACPRKHEHLSAFTWGLRTDREDDLLNSLWNQLHNNSVVYEEYLQARLENDDRFSAYTDSYTDWRRMAAEEDISDIHQIKANGSPALKAKTAEQYANLVIDSLPDGLADLRGN
ncbi:hypothetical protein JKP88DRAFT_289970 [Tribonema minus]|uniref:Uncharacterized protein n=1 Tax=Tribonema minus TaxID=303371 RepID=A0A836CHX1_9STRA|nr:hypothetical protein JKP88DRAFT_289970 [Tribonema minus]